MQKQVLIGLVFTKCCLRAPVSCARINRFSGGFSPPIPPYTSGYVHEVQSISLFIFPCLDAALRATVCKMCGTYLAAMIDVYYFSAHSVCLKLAADVPALDMVHLKFSVWVHFLRQTNQPDCRLPVVDVYLLISGRKLSPFHRTELLFLRYLKVTWESVCLLGV